MAANMRFNDSTSVGNTGDLNYGRLYTYDEALVACPNGWHLPSDEEWKVFEIALGMTSPESFEGAEDDGSFSYTLTEKQTTFSKRKQETSNSGGSSLASIAIIATKNPIPQAKALCVLVLGMYGIYTIYQLNGVEIRGNASNLKNALYDF
jgi:uncharacterized protein (TIGR02145 family)